MGVLEDRVKLQKMGWDARGMQRTGKGNLGILYINAHRSKACRARAAAALPHAPSSGCSLGLVRGDNPGLDVVAFSQRVGLNMDEPGTCCVCLAGQSWRKAKGKEEMLLSVVRLLLALLS